MPPKVKITKEDIINSALGIIRKYGADALNARTVASALGCSTQPIFSNFATMDDFRFAVIERIENIYNAYTRNVINSGEFPEYKASGMAYIRFAKEEKELFKLLYMRDRSGEDFSIDTSITDEMESVVSKEVGIDSETAKLFHLEMWAYVHGIATMLATGFFDLDMALVSRMLTDCYQGLRQQYRTE